MNDRWVSKENDNPMAGSSHGVGSSGKSGVAKDYNLQALIPYVPPFERSKMLSSFKRFMVNKLDFISVTQKEHYERVEARFEHLDQQIEAM